MKRAGPELRGAVTARRLAFRAGALAVLAFGLGCGLLLDWSDYTGGNTAAQSSDSGPSDAAQSGDSGATGPSADSSDGDGGDSAGPTADGPTDASPAADAAANADGTTGIAGLVSCGVNQVCAPLPQGWIGPAELFAGSPADALPTCDPQWTTIFDGNSGLQAAAASCEPCSCSPPQGAGCVGPTVSIYADPGCATPCGPNSFELTTVCHATSGCASALISAPAPSDGGACVASGGSPTYDAAVTWSGVVRACAAAAPSQGSCGAGSVCVSLPQPPFERRLCVAAAAQTSPCPLPYTDRVSYFANGFVDTRTCSACGCDPPTGASCSFPSGSGWLLRYIDPTAACFVPGPPVDPAGCIGVGPGGLRLAAAPKFDAGNCAPTGGQAVGSVEPSAAEVFCCTP